MSLSFGPLCIVNHRGHSAVYQKRQPRLSSSVLFCEAVHNESCRSTSGCVRSKCKREVYVWCIRLHRGRGRSRGLLVVACAYASRFIGTRALARRERQNPGRHRKCYGRFAGRWPIALVESQGCAYVVGGRAAEGDSGRVGAYRVQWVGAPSPAHKLGHVHQITQSKVHLLYFVRLMVNIRRETYTCFNEAKTILSLSLTPRVECLQRINLAVPSYYPPTLALVILFPHLRYV